MKSDKLPAFQFYPGDWRKDPGVQALTYEQRGVWFEMICLMHESDQRGVLLLNGQPMPEQALAMLLGLDKGVVNQIVTTLLSYGVASRQPDTGAIYCRRMVRDEELRQQRTEAGKKGGNPALVKGVVKGMVNHQDNQKSTPSSSSSSSSSSSNIATEQQGAVAPAAGAATPPADRDEAPPLALTSEPPPKPRAAMGALADAEKPAADIAALEKRKSRAAAAIVVPIPIILDTEAFRLRWASWLQYRREMKKPLTPTSQSQQLDNFLKIGEARAIAMIEHTITMGWQGLREPEAPAGGAPRAGPGNIGAAAVALAELKAGDVSHPTHDFGLGQLSDGSFITPAGKKIMDARPNNVF